MNHDSIKSRQDSIAAMLKSINTLGSKTLADNSVFTLNTLTQHSISRENDALDKDNCETE